MRALDIIRHPVQSFRALKSIPFERGDGGMGGYGAISFYQGLVDAGLSFQSQRINYESEVGDLANTELMASAIRWVSKNLADARLYVASKDSDNKETEIADHPLIQLYDTPNPYYSGQVLLRGLVASRLTRATSYIRKVRNLFGQVIQLWWEPTERTRARWSMDGGGFIDYFEVWRNGAWYAVKKEDMIALYDGGLDPVTREGCNGISSLWAEFYADKQGARYMANLLRHGLVPPVAIGLGNATTPGPTGDDLKLAKKEMLRKFHGQNAGEPFMSSGPVTVEKLGFDYSSVGMRDVRRIPEERFCSVIGISPQSLRLGLGQENSTYNNVEGYTRLDYQDYIMPLQREIAAELTKQLLPEFGDTDGLMIGWNYDNVALLAEDKYKESERIRGLFKDRVLNLAQALEAISYNPQPGDEKIYYPVPQTNITLSPIGESLLSDVIPPEVKPNGGTKPS